MSKWSELKQLAESTPHQDWYAGNVYDKRFILKNQIITNTDDGKYVLFDGNSNFPEHCVANTAFVGSASPKAILELIAHVETLEVSNNIRGLNVESAEAQLRRLAEIQKEEDGLEEVHWNAYRYCKLVDERKAILAKWLD